jgi:hypothetical protein
MGLICISEFIIFRFFASVEKAYGFAASIGNLHLPEEPMSEGRVMQISVKYERRKLNSIFTSSRLFPSLFLEKGTLKLHSQELVQLMDQKRRPNQSLEYSEHAYPKSSGMLDVIDNRAQKSQPITPAHDTIAL